MRWLNCVGLIFVSLPEKGDCFLRRVGNSSNQRGFAAVLAPIRYACGLSSSLHDESVSRTSSERIGTGCCGDRGVFALLKSGQPEFRPAR
jgi:hypothetical protein